MSLQSLSKNLFLAFVFFLPFQMVYFLREPFIHGEKWQYGTVAVYASDGILFLVLILFFVSGGYIRKIFDFRYWILDLKSRIKHLKSESALLVALILWAGLSIMWVPDRFLAGYFFVKLSLAVGLFLAVRSLGERSVRGVILALIIGAVLESVLGIGQFLTQSTFASTWLGMSAHEAGLAGTSVLKIDGQRWLRAYGTFPHPNMLGGFLAVVFTLGVGYATFYGEKYIRTVLLSRAELRESGASLQDRFWDTVRMAGIVVALAVILLGLILTFSRSAWLGAVLGTIAYGIWCIKYPVWRKPYFWILGVLGIAAVVFIGLLHETVFPRFDTAVIEREGSVSERVQSLRDAERVIGEGNLLLGTGAGNFTAAVMLLEPVRPVWSVQPAHNVPVLIFAELGLVGFLLFVGFLVFSLSSILKSRIINPESTILIVLLPSLFLDHWIWTSHFGLFFFFLLLGFAVRK